MKFVNDETGDEFGKERLSKKFSEDTRDYISQIGDDDIVGFGVFMYPTQRRIDDCMTGYCGNLSKEEIEQIHYTWAEQVWSPLTKGMTRGLEYNVFGENKALYMRNITKKRVMELAELEYVERIQHIFTETC